MAHPIWKDYIVNLGTQESIGFKIEIDGATIYTGKSIKRPGATKNEIRINDICADALTEYIQNLSQAEISALSLPITIDIFKNTGAGWVDADSVEFINDWSYDASRNPVTQGMASPINGHVAHNQWLIHTLFGEESVGVTYTFKDGTSETTEVETSREMTFGTASADTDFSRSVETAGSGSIAVSLASQPNLASVTIGNCVYRVVDKCCRYVLHYLNAYGGWDSLLIEGESMETDTFTRFTRVTEYDNRSERNRGTRNHLNEITKGITLHTGWMSDDESLGMRHLISSTDVYLEVLGENRFIPVLISDTALQYKTYRNQGGRLVNYDIAVTFADNRVRR